MTTPASDQAVARRREIFAAVSTATGRQDAVDAIGRLLGVDADAAAAVLAAPLESFVGPVPESAGPTPENDGFALHPFRAENSAHADLYRRRAADETSATQGSWDSLKTVSEQSAAVERIELESAMWFVASDTARERHVGLVMGEQTDDGEVDVAIWIDPSERKKGYGMAALRESYREFPAFFPGRSVVVRAPLAGDGV